MEDDECISKTEWTEEEARKLLEAGFEFVCDFHEVKIFRNASTEPPDETPAVFNIVVRGMGFEPVSE